MMNAPGHGVVSRESRTTIGIVGAGVMGAGIAQVLAVSGNVVVCYDVDADAAIRAKATVVSGRFGLGTAVERGKLTESEASEALERLTFSTDREFVSGADVIIEAVPEDLALKVRIFRELDHATPPHTILASNSSGFPIAALAAATDRPDRVIGWHWASPAPVMRFAEIVRTNATSDTTVETIRALAAAAGKHPVVVNDQPRSWGYVANRIYAAMMAEARRVAEEGVADMAAIDRLLVDCFRWPTGPFAMVQGASEGWSLPGPTP
jgi:3-hydroxybutyryl-CoA dehydrogenase/3-hydroxyacyl-CoA dehydrogenase